MAMDSRLERYLRRDANGVPQSLSQDDVKSLSRKFGSDTVQQAIDEIARQQKAFQDSADTRAQAEQGRKDRDADNALKIQQAATQAAQVQALNQKNKNATDTANALNQYRGSGVGETMAVLNGGLSPILGMGAGYALAQAPRAAQNKTGDARNVARQALTPDANDALAEADPAMRMAKLQSVADTARQNSLVPGSSLGRGLARFAPYGGIGAAMLAEGAYLRHSASDPAYTPLQSDARDASGTAAMGAGAGMMGSGLKYALNPGVVPDSDALYRINLANNSLSALKNTPSQPANALASPQEQPINALASLPQDQQPANALAQQPQAALSPPSEPEITPTAPEAAAQSASSKYRGMKPSDAVLDIGRDLGVKPVGTTKGDRASNLLSHIDNAHPDVLRAVAAGVPGVDETGSVSSIRKGLQSYITDNIANSTKRLTSVLGPAGAMLGGGLALTLGGDDANAGPARDESSTHFRARQVGNALYGMGQGAVDAAPYMVPGLGEVLTARDLINLDNSVPPSKLTLRNAQSTGQDLVANSNLDAAKADQERQIYEMQHPRMSDAALFPGMTQTPAATQNALALSGPDGKFYQALRDFQDHFAQLKAAGAQANQ